MIATCLQIPCQTIMRHNAETQSRNNRHVNHRHAVDRPLVAPPAPQTWLLTQRRHQHAPTVPKTQRTDKPAHGHAAQWKQLPVPWGALDSPEPDHTAACSAGHEIAAARNGHRSHPPARI